jgi:hypothetical protein
MTEVVRGRWYPNQPPALPGEDDDAYTNRLTGCLGPELRPYDHRRNRQCSIGWHEECSDRVGLSCECPCHPERVNAAALVEAFNAGHPVGTVMVIPACPEEPPVATTSPARVDGLWPVVDLDGFPNPVKLSWLEAKS